MRDKLLQIQDPTTQALNGRRPCVSIAVDETQVNLKNSAGLREKKMTEKAYLGKRNVHKGQVVHNRFAHSNNHHRSTPC